MPTAFPLLDGSRTFRSLQSFRKFAKKHGCKVRKVSQSKTNTYYQMLHDGVIVGFFNTAFGGAVK